MVKYRSDPPKLAILAGVATENINCNNVQYSLCFHLDSL